MLKPNVRSLTNISSAKAYRRIQFWLGSGIAAPPTAATFLCNTLSGRPISGDEHLGVIMDRAEAAKWYRRAAEQGEKSVGLGQRDLGRLYEKGWGVPKDDVLAYMWYNLAAAKEGDSFSTAASHRDTLAEHMTPAQIAEGQRLTREWKPKPETRKMGMWDTISRWWKRDEP